MNNRLAAERLAAYSGNEGERSWRDQAPDLSNCSTVALHAALTFCPPNIGCSYPADSHRFTSDQRSGQCGNSTRGARRTGMVSTLPVQQLRGLW